MGEVVGQLLPTAVGVALSPIPIVAVVLMPATPRGRVNGPVFVAAWILGLAVAMAIVIAAAGDDATTDDGAPAGWVSWLKLVLGLGLLAIALKQWRGRPRGDAEPELPKWMQALEGDPRRAAGLDSRGSRTPHRDEMQPGTAAQSPTRDTRVVRTRGPASSRRGCPRNDEDEDGCRP